MSWFFVLVRNSFPKVPDVHLQLIVEMCAQIFGFVMCTAITLLAIYKASQIDLKRSIFFYEAYGAISFVKHFNLGRTIIKFLHSCFNFMWNRHRGFTDHKIKPIFCKSMRTKISMCIFQPMVDASELLQLFSEDELEKLSLDVQYKHYFANEFIIRPDTIGHNMFYIIDGSVEVMSEDDPTMPIFTFKNGSLIGEVNITCPTRRDYGVKTRTPSDILLLPFASVLNVSKLGIGRLDEMHRIINTRMDWLAEENEKHFKQKLSLVVEEHRKDQQRLSLASSDTIDHDYDSLEPMDLLMYARIRAMSGKKDESERRHSSEKSPLKNRVGAQFMSVLAWLNFYKGERRVKRKGESEKSADIYAKMKGKYRNDASMKMYNMVPTIFSTPRCMRYHLTIAKESNIYKFWEAFVIIVVVAHTIVYPIEILIATKEFCQIFNASIEFVFIMDLLFRLCVFMEIEEIVPAPFTISTHIAREFRTHNIWFDIMAVLPIHHFVSLEQISYREYMYSRIHMYIFKSVKLLDFIRSWENNVIISVTVIRLLKHLLFISTYIAWLGSTFTYVGCPKFPNCLERYKAGKTWVDEFFVHASISNEPYQRQDFVYALPLSLFWATCAVFGIQFDIVTPVTYEETTLQTFGVVGGFAMITYFGCDIAATLAGAVENRIHHVDKVIWLKRYMDDQLVDLRLIARVTSYMGIQWRTLRGLSSDSTNTIGFLSVSHTMYTELVVHIVAECLFQTYFFQHMDTDLLRKFSLAATLFVIPPNEEIIKYGDLVSRMYIIRRGYVQVYYRDTDIKVSSLTTGQSFGEVNMFHGKPIKVTIRSVTYVELIMLDSRAFDRILSLSKIHQDELARFRSDKAKLKIFEESLEVVVANMPTSEIVQRKYRTPLEQPSPYRRFNAQKPKNIHGVQFVNPISTEINHKYILEFDKLKCCKCIRYWLMPVSFLPNGVVLRYWEKFRIFTICLIMFFVPISEAYPTVKAEYQYYIIILDLLTFMDMYARAHIAYYDDRTKELMTHPLATVKHYLTSGFLADLYGSVIVYAIIDNSFRGSSIDASLFVYIMRLNRLVLIYRILGYYKYKNEDSITTKPVWRLIKLIPVYFYYVHLIGCCASVIACPSTTQAFIKNNNQTCYNNTWVTASKHEEKSPGAYELYIYSFYYIATTSIGFGSGDFKPSNEIERYCATFLYLGYIFILTCILASIAGSKNHIDYKLLRFQQHMKYLVGYIVREKLDSKLSGRIIRHYNFQWLRTKGIEPQKLFSNLFPALRKEVALDVFEDVLNEIPEFRNVSEGFLRAVCVFLVPVYYLRHDIIVRRSDICDTIYFIFRGKVAISVNVNEDEIQLTTGGIIGILDTRLQTPVYNTTAISITNVDVFAIPRKDFIRVLKAYPDVALRFADRNKKEADELDVLYERVCKEHPVDPDPEKHIKEIHKFAKSKRRSLEREGGYVLQDEIRREDSELKFFSDHSISLVLEEDPDKSKAKYDEDTLYAESILPESKCVKALTILVFLAASVSTTFAFFQWSFENYGPAFFVIGYLCDVMFIVKMCLSFRVSYFNYQGDVVVDTTEISNKYLSDSSGFALDFLSTIPLEVFVGVVAATTAGRENNYALAFYYWVSFRLNRLARLIHVVRYYKKRIRGFRVHLVPVKLERIFVGTLIYIHFSACILYRYTRSHEASDHGFALARAAKDPTLEHTKDFTAWYQTKIETEGNQNLTDHKYSLSLYFILTTFTTTAYGDVYPVTISEMIFTCVFAFSSKLWLGFVLSDILSGLQSNTDLTYHLAAGGVLQLYKDYGVSKDVLEKTAQYFKYAWRQNRGILFPDFLARAPASLKMDICTHVYGDHFRKSYLFHDLSESFVRQACIRLKPEWIVAGDYVVRQGEIDDKLYFIHRGIVEFSKDESVAISRIRNSIERRARQNRHQGTSLNHGFISRSKYFGEAQGILGPQHHMCSYRAETNLDVVGLCHNDIEELFDLFPECRSPILARFYGRYSSSSYQTSSTIALPSKLVLLAIDRNTYSRDSDEESLSIET